MLFQCKVGCLIIQNQENLVFDMNKTYGWYCEVHKAQFEAMLQRLVLVWIAHVLYAMRKGKGGRVAALGRVTGCALCNEHDRCLAKRT